MPTYPAELMPDVDAAVAQVYTQHAARILAVLVRIFGTRHFELAEDVLQDAFSKAVVAWQQRGVPDNPAAWILTATKHLAI